MKAIPYSHRRFATAIAGTISVWVLTGLLSARADFFVASDWGNQLIRYDNDGQFIRVEVQGPGSTGAGFAGLTQGPDGAMYFGYMQNNTVYRFDATTRNLSVFATSPVPPQAIAFGGPGGDLYAGEPGTWGVPGEIVRFDGHSGAYKGVVTQFPVAVPGGPVGAVNGPVGVAVDAAGNVYGTERGGNLWRWDGTSLVPLTSGIQAEALYLGRDNSLYVGGFDQVVRRYSLSGTLERTYTGLSGWFSTGLVMAPPGLGDWLFVAEEYSGHVVKIDMGTGLISDFISSVQTPYGIAFGPSGPAGTFAPIDISSVPEPATWVAGVGTLALAGLLFRRRN